jgi:hypothetical protein
VSRLDGDAEGIFPLGRGCCGAPDVSACHQAGLCWMEGVHPNSPGSRPAAPAPGAVSRPDGEVCDCLNPMCSHRSARPAAPAVEADLRESLAKWLYLNTAPPSRHPAEPGRVWLAGSALTAADALLAGPLRSLVEQAAEAARLRGTVTRAEALHSRRGIPLADIWCTQDGADG